MIAISLWQPWASALFAPRPGERRSLKANETRKRPLPAKYAGKPVAIHAAKRDTREEKAFWMAVVQDTPRRELYARAFASIGIRSYAELPRGCIIGTVVFGESVRTTGVCDVGDSIEAEWGDYRPGRWAWPATELRLFSKPVPCLGRQGFFYWTPEGCPQLELVSR